MRIKINRKLVSVKRSDPSSYKYYTCSNAEFIPSVFINANCGSSHKSVIYIYIAAMEKLSAAVLILVLSGLLLSETCWGLKIAAFNIQVFGPTKMGKPAVVDILAKVSIYLYINYTISH